MSKMTWADLAAATWLSTVVNRGRRLLGLKGRHRSIGISTFEWVRMQKLSRVC